MWLFYQFHPSSPLFHQTQQQHDMSHSNTALETLPRFYLPLGKFNTFTVCCSLGYRSEEAFSWLNTENIQRSYAICIWLMCSSHVNDFSTAHYDSYDDYFYRQPNIMSCGTLLVLVKQNNWCCGAAAISIIAYTECSFFAIQHY